MKIYRIAEDIKTQENQNIAPIVKAVTVPVEKVEQNMIKDESETEQVKIETEGRKTKKKKAI